MEIRDSKKWIPWQNIFPTGEFSRYAVDIIERRQLDKLVR